MSVSELYKKILVIFSLPIILGEYFDQETGKEFGLNFPEKLHLIYKFFRNTKTIPSATFFLEHLVMTTKILKIPKSKKGAVAEFGSYKGASTANLSLICQITGRTLEVFDSFAGLPRPARGDKHHILTNLSQIHEYKKGAYRASLHQVQNNVLKYGHLPSCKFHKGFFHKTLPNFSDPIVFAFMDVDLVESIKDVILGLWPLLRKGSYVFVHEAHHDEIASLFYDKFWWQKNLKTKAPGLIGAGSGLGLIPHPNAYQSSLGYTIKDPSLKNFNVETQEK